ncbi:MAG: acetyl-CoA carboxylase, biotin carboxyl carrier protein [Crocinitomicaceae bacterium]|nr:acetyl-CoA carboxylase, biotin carboxyl carrier protein [Crocinitomicaceae bacterium]|tara:strand:- start:1295 stop:1801 length:507 start_codon:yes stop_codon:yes gene_type:complete
MNINEIQDLIKFVAKAGVNEVEIEKKDFKIVIKSDYMAKKKTNFKEEPTIVQQQIPVGNIAAQPVAAAPAPVQEAAPAAPAEKEEDNSNLITVKAQMIGTFYRSPGPDKDPFVEVGSTIKAGDKLCIIEAMKLFNEIESEVSGKIVKVLAEDQSPIEFDQPLFLVDPS